MRRLLSVNDLAWRLHVRPERLKQIADEIRRDPRSHYAYRKEWNRKRTKSRDIMEPSRDLKDLQRRIKAILAEIDLGDDVHGGLRGRSPRSNAAQHLGRRFVVTMDVKNFFPSARHYIVLKMFLRELHCGRDVARLLTRLTTVDGQLPQGAPTSTAVANLLLARAVDEPLSLEARRVGARSTRFVDDFALSGDYPQALITKTARFLSTRRLPVWRADGAGRGKGKLKITPRSRRQEVTGLVVNSPHGPSLSRQKRDRVRAAIFQLRGIAEPERQGAVLSIRGRIAHVKAFNPGAAKRLQRALDSFLAS